MMPKSTATMSPAASTKRLPWCMSAWKKPSRSAWRRKACISRRASAGRSWPAARSAATSDSLMPSIHSSVSTSRAVSSHSTFGTRKPGSPAVLSAISESAAASSRRSISMRDRARQRVDHRDRPQPPRLRVEPLDQARAGIEGLEVAREAAADAGPQHLDRDRPRLAIRAGDLRLVDLGDRGGGDRRRERGEDRVDRLAEARPRPSPALPPRETARSRRGAGRARRRRRRRRCRAASRGTGRA